MQQHILHLFSDHDSHLMSPSTSSPSYCSSMVDDEEVVVVRQQQRTPTKRSNLQQNAEDKYNTG